MDVWRSKLGISLKKDGFSQQSMDRMAYGHILEGVVAKRYAKRHGLWLLPGKFKRLDWRLGTPDFTFYEQRIGLEIKTTGDEKVERAIKSGQFPEYWEYQCRWYMMLMDYDEWHLACLVGGQREYSTIFKRDAIIERDFIERCSIFWHENVLKHIPPGGLKFG